MKIQKIQKIESQFGLWEIMKIDHEQRHVSPARKWTHKSKTFLKNKRKQAKKQAKKNNKQSQRSSR